MDFNSSKMCSADVCICANEGNSDPTNIQHISTPQRSGRINRWQFKRYASRISRFTRLRSVACGNRFLETINATFAPSEALKS